MRDLQKALEKLVDYNLPMKVREGMPQYLRGHLVGVTRENFTVVIAVVNTRKRIRERVVWHDLPTAADISRAVTNFITRPDLRTYECPLGHDTQFYLAIIICPTCMAWCRCAACQWEGEWDDIERYVGNKRAHEILGVPRDKADGGMYALCPSCGKGRVIGRLSGWNNEDELLARGGRIVIKEVQP